MRFERTSGVSADTTCRTPTSSHGALLRWRSSFSRFAHRPSARREGNVRAIVNQPDAIPDPFAQKPVELPRWLEDLRRTEIVDWVHNDPRSVGHTFLGVDRKAVLDDVINWGQAEFDEPWNDLSGEDRALAYAYFNQPGHLKELVEAFRQIFADASRPSSPIVVDLGCGPFTGGLAISTSFDSESHLDYIGVDRYRVMRDLGERLAAAASKRDETPTIDRHWSADVRSVGWPHAPGFRPVIVIVSFLLASPTLDPVNLVRELEGLLSRIGRGAVTLLYTNSLRQEANRSFPAFRTELRDSGFDLIANDRGRIEVDGWSGTRDRKLRYALFHRPKQTTLKLGPE